MLRKLIYRCFSMHTRTKRKVSISKLLIFVIPLVDCLEKICLRFILDFAVIHCIRFYQKYLSPRKGFSCAYSVLYRCESCSEYFRKTVKIYGLKKAIFLFQKRLEECKLAYRELLKGDNKN